MTDTFKIALCFGHKATERVLINEYPSYDDAETAAKLLTAEYVMSTFRIITIANSDDSPTLYLDEVFPAPPSRDEELYRIANLPLEPSFDDTGLELLELDLDPDC